MNDLRDPRVDDAYRNTPQDEPPAETDERIRAAARRAVSSHPTPLQERKPARWRVPLSLAATVVLAVTVAVLVREEAERPHADVPASVAPPRAAPARPAEQDTERRDRKATSAPAQEERPANAARQEKATAPAAPPAPRPRAAQDAPPRPSVEAPAPAAAPPVDAFEAPADPSLGASAHERQQPTVGPFRSPLEGFKAPTADDAPPSLRMDRASPERPERGEREAARAFAPPRSPEEWLDEIRRLKATGLKTEAAAELASFRRRYPGYALPADLQE